MPKDTDPMTQLKMHTPDLSAQNVEKLLELFPNVATETRDTEGNLVRGIDLDQLRQELADRIVEGPQERYRLDWPGKREAMLVANAPISRTLRPCRDQSVNFDTTKNLFIEGDNLDALKLIQDTYLSKVKLIYIDPPYNTGNDFIYDDDFVEDSDTYLKRSNQKDEEGNRLVVNQESNGRFHSDWLNMMYPRLKLARNLLKDDGVIFISIDDRELSNLIKMCDEIFGGKSFVANFVWEKRTNRENRKNVSGRHDNIVCYIRNPQKSRALKQLPMTEKALANYKNPDNDQRGLWKSDPATAQAGHGTKSQFYTLVAPNGTRHELESGRCWLYTESAMNSAIKDNRIWFGRDGHGVPRIKTYLEDKDRGLTPESILFADDNGTNESAKNRLKDLFDDIAVFETPKPTELLKTIIKMGCDDGVVLDFFAGSGTLCEAVFELKLEQPSITRKFIMVQIPEPVEANAESMRLGLGTISDLTKERIRRSGKLIFEEWQLQQASPKPQPDLMDTTAPDLAPAAPPDIGFRVLKIDESNFDESFYKKPDEIQQTELLSLVDNIKSDRTGVDLLFQVLLDWGVDLALPIVRETLQGKTVYFVDRTALAACFDKGVDEALIREIAARKPLRAVFRDSSYERDDTKINAIQIFAQLSPTTDVRTL
jgi:adenine-specific DNA-methyltransferase